ncbi:MAG: hypothetical protein HFJ35_02570 [Clostridia bacterium]|nr:hypothetical protein [Clostridia bacterium]
MLKLFDNIGLIIRNNNLKKELKKAKEENALNREDTSNLEIQKLHAKSLANYTISKLIDLEEIDRSGNSEESKRKQRNVIFNELRKKNINIINELSNKLGNDR